MIRRGLPTFGFFFFSILSERRPAKLVILGEKKIRFFSFDNGLVVCPFFFLLLCPF